MGTEEHGYEVFRTEFAVVRAQLEGETIKIRVHELVDGDEKYPLGYIVGSNILLYVRRR